MVKYPNFRNKGTGICKKKYKGLNGIRAKDGPKVLEICKNKILWRRSKLFLFMDFCQPCPLKFLNRVISVHPQAYDARNFKPKVPESAPP